MYYCQPDDAILTNNEKIFTDLTSEYEVGTLVYLYLDRIGRMVSSSFSSSF